MYTYTHGKLVSTQSNRLRFAPYPSGRGKQKTAELRKIYDITGLQIEPVDTR